jgi:glycosyltransferase involved in cell wall biosynthesis
VDYPFTLKDAVFTALGKSKAPLNRMVGFDNRLRDFSEGDSEIYHLTLPPVLPINWIKKESFFKKMTHFQSRVIRGSIKKAMHQLDMTSPIVINAFNPAVGVPLIGRLNEKANLYYCYDEISAAAWCGKHGKLMEDQLISLVNGVITTSQHLFETKSKHHLNTELIKNGVDYALFNQAYNQDRFENSTKTIGYVGSIDFRLDVDLLKAVIQFFPNHQFHFIGRVVDLQVKEALEAYPNVQFLGAKSPTELVKSMKNIDLGLIPFVKNDFTKSIYPLKINEYLAAGIPVVSTDFADLSDFVQSTSITETKEEFIHAITTALNADNETMAKARMEIAKKNDWKSRATQLFQLIEKVAQ